MQHLLSGWHGITNRKFNKKESANEIARLSLHKEARLNKRLNIIYACFPTTVCESKFTSEFDSNVATEFHSPERIANCLVEPAIAKSYSSGSRAWNGSELRAHVCHRDLLR